MYTATMIYPVNRHDMDEFVRIWKQKVLDLAVVQPGFTRMQLLTRNGEAMAMGTWENKSSAEAFMAAGPFTDLMAAAGALLSGTPVPTVWETAAFASR